MQKYPKHIPIISLFLIYQSSTILSQQPYIRKATTSCHSTETKHPSILGYTCNGLSRSCQAYLTFRAKPPYNSISTISKLLSANQSQLARLNSLSENEPLETNRIILVPIACSCSGHHYQANASYVIEHSDTYFTIANYTFQGLTTCQALQAQNSNFTRYLYSGTRMDVPLRCACPTKNQSDDGVKYLLSYLVTWNDYVSSISGLFGVDTGKTLSANELSEKDSTIYPFTTLLLPLQNPPSISKTTPSSSLHPPPPSDPPSGGGSSKAPIYVVIGAVGGLVLASVIGGIVFCLIFSGKKKQKSESVITTENFVSADQTPEKEVDGHSHSQDLRELVSGIAQSTKVYTIEELKAATGDFSPDFLIKGSVYRGVINGDFSAIKKMSGDVTKEIEFLTKINHFNIIRLSGVCFDEGHWYLSYEYAANGPLSNWIHHNDCVLQKIISWEERLQIALDVATGLNYLHRHTSPPQVHKDLSSRNVLLDQDFRAKIKNFALARSSEWQEGHFALTRHIVGTQGYMAPEYLENGMVSPKLDVYAFGVLFLEILTGKEVSLLSEKVDGRLSEILTPELHEENGVENLRDLVDPLLQGKYPPKIALLVLKLIDSCIKSNPLDRPSTDEIVHTLSRISTSTLYGGWEISISE